MQQSVCIISLSWAHNNNHSFLEHCFRRDQENHSPYNQFYLINGSWLLENKKTNDVYIQKDCYNSIAGANIMWVQSASSMWKEFHTFRTMVLLSRIIVSLSLHRSWSFRQEFSIRTDTCECIGTINRVHQDWAIKVQKLCLHKVHPRKFMYSRLSKVGLEIV